MRITNNSTNKNKEAISAMAICSLQVGVERFAGGGAGSFKRVGVRG